MSSTTQNVANEVRRIVSQDPVATQGLARGLINIRALAREVQSQLSGSVGLDAVISAIRREPTVDAQEGRARVGAAITKLSMKNEMVSVALRNTSEAPSLLAGFSKEVDYAGGETLRIVSGPQVLRLTLDSKNLARLLVLVPKRQLLAVDRDLSEIVVNHSEEIVRTSGVVVAMLSEIAIEQVSMLDCSATHGPPPQLSIVVAEGDALRAYRALERLRGARRTARSGPDRRAS